MVCAAATKSLREDYTEISEVLLQLSVNLDESLSTRNEANGLYKKIQKLETAICTTMWDSILQRIDCVSKDLQNPSLNLSVVPEYFSSIIDYVNFVHDRYEMLEEETFVLVGYKDYSVKRQKKKPPKSFYDGQCEETLLDSRDNFKISCFYVACDTLITHLK